MNKYKYYVIVISILITITKNLSAQISTANQDDFNYEHQLIYNYSALIFEGDENNLDDNDKKIIKEYNLKSNDYRYIYWNRVPKEDMKSYLPWNIERTLRLKKVEEKYFDGQYTLLTYNDCERGLILQTRLWDDNKTVSISWEWYSKANWNKSRYLIGCSSQLESKIDSKKANPNSLYKGKKYSQQINKN